MKRIYTATIPTIGYVMIEVEARDEEEARRLILAGKGTTTEENTGDWADGSEWEWDEWEPEPKRR